MLTSQALVLIVAFIIFGIIFIMNALLPSTNTMHEKLIVLAVMFFVIVPLMITKVYTVQCMINGNCNMFAWVVVGLSLVLSLIYLLMFLKKMINKKKELDASILLLNED